jgi:dihydroflavonol-4-reductase
MPADEGNVAVGSDSHLGYHRSKILQERAALAARIPVVLVLPTAPVGPGDWKPTPTGKMIVDFMKGRMLATFPGGLNVVAVEDVARAHVLALERGEPNRRYLVGGTNLELQELWTQLGRLCGRRPPRFEMPFSLALGLAWADEIRCRIQAATPMIPIEGVRMGVEKMFVSSDRARQELDLCPTSVSAALEGSVRWYRDHGYAD